MDYNGGIMKTEKTRFGTMADGTGVELYTLTNARGVVAKITNYGARLVEMWVPDRGGKMGNVVLGFDGLAGYFEPKEPYFGCTVGRVANRIAGGEFVLEEKVYRLARNDGRNTLHGGLVGFDKRVWKAAEVKGPGAGVKFSYVSADMEEGFPGEVAASVVYMLDDQNELWIEYYAKASKTTLVNLTNHSYFNLAGAGCGDILGHELMIAADRYTPVDDQLIPTGEMASVKGTAMDFRKAERIGARLGEVKGGYDHNYALNDYDGTLAKAARVVERGSGRVMEVATTQPGVQLYTGNFLDGSLSGNGGVYGKHGAFCLETQHFPDAVHHGNFPSVVLKAGGTYRQVARFGFGVE